MTNAVRFTTAEVAKICDRSQRTIRDRWIPEGMFSEYIKVKDGYLFLGSTVVKCFTKVQNGESVPMTLIEIAELHGVAV